MKALVVVEDNQAQSRLVYLILSHAFPGELTYRMCASGSEALLAIQSGEKFDVAIVDLHLGDVPGERVVEQFRNVSPDMKILVLTGMHLDSRSYQKARTFADEVMTKDGCEDGLADLFSHWFGLEVKK